jgi:uncharacterized membrane protein YdbT with pleckstrin-like domain
MNNERIAWSDRPSQLQNLGWFLSCLVLLPIPYALWRWLVTRSTVYTLTDQRLKTVRGVFTRSTDDLELYRVRDSKLQQSLWERLFGLGELTLYTTDASTPEVHLCWIRNAESVRETLRTLVEARREQKQVRTLEGDHDSVH